MRGLCCPSFRERNGRISLFHEHSSESRSVPVAPDVSGVKSSRFLLPTEPPSPWPAGDTARAPRLGSFPRAPAGVALPAQAWAP